MPNDKPYATNDIQDPEGIASAISYTWYRLPHPGGTAEQVGTDSTYTLTANDIGRYIQICASYSNGRGEPERVWSSCTRSVANVNDPVTGAIVIEGMVTEGQTLRAKNQLGDADGLGQLDYVWQQTTNAAEGPWTDIPNATSETYVLRSSDIGRVIRVKVSYVDGRGTREGWRKGDRHIAGPSLSQWAAEAAGDAITGFQAKRIRSGVETLLASAGVSQEVRGRLQSHGISGVQARHYDGHEYLAEKRKALETLYALLEQQPVTNVTPITKMRA